MYLIRKYQTDGMKTAEALHIANFRPESSDHHPVTDCRVLYDDRGLYLNFQVQDRYVKSTVTKFQQKLCIDSCVEFFAQPSCGEGYVNFEFNAGGNLLCFHIIDHQRVGEGFAKSETLGDWANEVIKRKSSLPAIVNPEITEPVQWTLDVFIPFSVFEYTHGLKRPPVSGDVWRANFYKCGDRTSHPHWASWQPVPKFNFHLPEAFGEIGFE